MFWWTLQQKRDALGGPVLRPMTLPRRPQRPAPRRHLLRPVVLVVVLLAVWATGRWFRERRSPAAAPTTTAFTLPPASDSVLRAGPYIVLSLPDTGGYSINGQPVRRDSLAWHLRAIYEPRAVQQRVLFFRIGRQRALADVAWAARQAQVAGARVYDASADTLDRFEPRDFTRP